MGAPVTFLSALQIIFLFQISEEWTRFSLWLNFLAIFCFALARFIARLADESSIHIVVFLTVAALTFPSVLLSRANIL